MKLALTKYCSLKDNRFFIDGTLVYEAVAGTTAHDFLISLYRAEKVSYPKFFKMDELSKAGFLSAELLLKGTSVYGVEPKTNTGIIINNHSSSLHTDVTYQETIGENYFPSPSIFVYTLPNIVMGEIAIRHKIYGENTFFVSEKFDSQLVSDYIYQLFLDSDLDQVITGWVEFNQQQCEVQLMLVEKMQSDSNPSMEFNANTIKVLYKQ